MQILHVLRDRDFRPTDRTRRGPAEGGGVIQSRQKDPVARIGLIAA
jgi:hypothetical protein